MLEVFCVEQEIRAAPRKMEKSIFFITERVLGKFIIFKLNGLCRQAIKIEAQHKKTPKKSGSVF